MQIIRQLRRLIPAIALFLIPAASFAGVFISVGFAPPALPVYVQPPCPEPGMMWTPGYWAYGDDGYYWVPGAWVPAPYEGALWTPGYWGWSAGFYMWHPGYWGRHVGYYGGVNYGFGYGGIGFAGGIWAGSVFRYNTAVVHVNETVIHNTYVDRTIVERNTVVNNRVSFNGGPGGINHAPTPEERLAARDQHMAPTSFQARHETMARSDRAAYFKSNNGRPQNTVAARPLQAEPHPGAANMARPGNPGARPALQGSQGGQQHNGFQQSPRTTQRPGGGQPQMQQHMQAQPHPQAQPHAQPQSQPHAQPHAAERPAPREHEGGGKPRR